MKTDFQLVGLGKPYSFTCSNIGKEDIFWPKATIPQDRFNALFAWAKSEDNFWKQKWIAEIEHEGFFEDGTPRNAVIVALREWDL